MNNYPLNKSISELYPAREAGKQAFIDKHDLGWVAFLAVVGTAVNFLPYSRMVSIAFQVGMAAVVVLGNLKRPVMLIVSFIFLHLMPARMVSGFHEGEGSVYTVNKLILSLMVIAFLFINLFITKEKYKGKFNKWLFAFAVILAASYTWTISFLYYDSSFLWMIIAYAFYPYLISSEKDIRLILISYFISMQIFGLTALPTLAAGEFYRGQIRLDPNFSSMALTFCVISALALLLQYKELLGRFLKAGLIAGIVFDVFILSFFASRTAFFGLAIIFLFFMVLNMNKPGTIVLSAAAVVISFFYFESRGLFDTVIKRFSAMDVDRFGGRTGIWRSLLVSIGRFNVFRLIFGNGYLTTGFFGAGSGGQAHNAYLSIFIGFGAIGLIIFMIYQVSSTVSIVRRGFVPFTLLVLNMLIYIFSLEPYMLSEGVLFLVLFGAMGAVALEREEVPPLNPFLNKRKNQ